MNGGIHTLHLTDESATRALAGRLAAHQPQTAAMVYLCGHLGAGKSTLARAWLRALGITGPIRSPTYTLVEPYSIPGGEALHLDLYRLGSSAEWDALGLEDADARLWLVEWPERARGRLPQADLHIDLALAGCGRTAVLTAQTPLGRTWLERLQTVDAC